MLHLRDRLGCMIGARHLLSGRLSVLLGRGLSAAHAEELVAEEARGAFLEALLAAGRQPA